MSLLHRMFHQRGTPAFRWTEGVVWALILASILLLGAELSLAEALADKAWISWLLTVAEKPTWKAVLIGFQRVDLVILALFALELSLRVLSWRPPDLDFYDRNAPELLWLHFVRRVEFLLRPMSLIDLAAILAVHPYLRGLRALRLLRLVRLWRVFRHANPITDIVEAFWINRILYRAAFTFLGAVTLLGGLSIFLVERGENPDIETLGDGLWWALVTLTTVGFGDITPITPLGRVLGAGMMIAGMFTLASFAGLVGSTLLTSILNFRMEQFRMTNTVGHLVVLGYTEGSRLLLPTLLEAVPRSLQIVLMAPDDRPEDLPRVMEWITGDPTRQLHLDRVRLAHADSVLVVGRRDLSPEQSDAQTLLTLFTIRAHLDQAKVPRRRPLHVVAEILDAENVKHARTAGADEVIESTQIGFSLLSHAVVAPGAAPVVSHVVRAGAYNLYEDPLPRDLPDGATFATACAYVRDTGAMLIGIHESGEEDEVINPAEDRVLSRDTKLIYLGKERVLGPKT